MGLCVKTVLPVLPTLEAECNGVFPRDATAGHMGWRCFEILGIDVMLDAKRKPYLIEINHLPSFTTDSPLDLDIKRRLVEQTLELTCGSVSAKGAKVYGELVSQRREGGASSTPRSSPQAAAAAEAPESLLDAPVYKDFDRAFPPPPEAAKLSAQCQVIHSRVQELFNPVHAVRRREASREPAGGAQKPPLLPPGGPAPSVVSVGTTGLPRAADLAKKRSLSAPGPHRCSLPLIPRSEATPDA